MIKVKRLEKGTIKKLIKGISFEVIIPTINIIARTVIFIIIFSVFADHDLKLKTIIIWLLMIWVFLPSIKVLKYLYEIYKNEELP